MDNNLKILFREALLNENDFKYKCVPTQLLRTVLSKVTSQRGKKLLKQWIDKSKTSNSKVCGKDTIRLTHKQYKLMNIIKSGEPIPKN